MADDRNEALARAQMVISETFEGKPLSEHLLHEIRSALAPGWTLDAWDYDPETGGLNIQVTGPVPPYVAKSELRHLSIVKDTNEEKP